MAVTTSLQRSEPRCTVRSIKPDAPYHTFHTRVGLSLVSSAFCSIPTMCSSCKVNLASGVTKAAAPPTYSFPTMYSTFNTFHLAMSVVKADVMALAAAAPPPTSSKGEMMLCVCGGVGGLSNDLFCSSCGGVTVLQGVIAYVSWRLRSADVSVCLRRSGPCWVESGIVGTFCFLASMSDW